MQPSRRKRKCIEVYNLWQQVTVCPCPIYVVFLQPNNLTSEKQLLWGNFKLKQKNIHCSPSRWCINPNWWPSPLDFAHCLIILDCAILALFKNLSQENYDNCMSGRMVTMKSLFHFDMNVVLSSFWPRASWSHWEDVRFLERPY